MFVSITSKPFDYVTKTMQYVELEEVVDEVGRMVSTVLPINLWWLVRLF